MIKPATMKPKLKKLTDRALLSAYESGGVTAVCKLCEPYKLPEVYCPDCESHVPLWEGVCAACWQEIPDESE